MGPQREEVRAGTKNWVRGAQLEPVRKENGKGASVCCSERKGRYGTDVHWQRGCGSMVWGDEMALGFLKTSDRASRENVAGHGSNTQLWLQRHLCHRGCQLRGAGRGALTRGCHYRSTLTSTGSLGTFQVQHKGFHQGRQKDSHLKIYRCLPEHSWLSEGGRDTRLAEAVPKGQRQG